MCMNVYTMYVFILFYAYIFICLVANTKIFGIIIDKSKDKKQQGEVFYYPSSRTKFLSKKMHLLPKKNLP